MEKAPNEYGLASSWTTLLKEDQKPKCFGNFPSCPKRNGILDPMRQVEENPKVKVCPLWRLCRTEYLSKVFDNPSFKHGIVGTPNES